MGWRARLSNGQFIREPETVIKDELSPWHLLIARCRHENLQIIELSLVRNGVLVTALPSLAAYKASGNMLAIGEKPPLMAEGYAALYEFGSQRYGRKKQELQGIGSLVGDLMFITWLDEKGHVFQDVRRLTREFQHTTERDKI